MGEPTPRRIRILVGPVTVEAELKPNKTAEGIFSVLPIEAPVNLWGEEFFFKIPGVKDYRETATTQVKVGDIAYWGIGQVLLVFFGRTPLSVGPDPVPADRVNVVGRILGEVGVLRQAKGAMRIRVEPA
jgi:hypothetical protein